MTDRRTGTFKFKFNPLKHACNAILVNLHSAYGVLGKLGVGAGAGEADRAL